MKYCLIDVEDRPVILYDNAKSTRAFVWLDGEGWTETPDLVGKSLVDGISLDADSFTKQFPDADLSSLPL